jgi:hypothetical protein
VKNVLPPSSLLVLLLDWINVHCNLCVHTAMQVAKFPLSHLKACGWYLDCSRAFVPDEEESLYGSLVNSGPDVIELDEGPDEPTLAPPSVEKDVAPVKDKGRGKKVLALASSQVSSRSNAKASIQRNGTPATTVVGSPTATLSAALANPVVAPSHSSVTIPSVPRKRKAVAPDTSATSSDMSSSLSLIENVDMGELIEDLMKTKVPPPAYRRIQDFLTKVYLHSYCFILSFNVFDHFFVFLTFFAFWPFRLERVVLVQTPSLRFTQALISCLQMCSKIYVFRASPPHPRMFLSGTSAQPLTSRFTFAFANANLHDDGVLIFAHAADLEVSRSIHNWAHTEDFYVAEFWFGMNDLNFQSPSIPSGLVLLLGLHPFSFIANFFHFCFPNSSVDNLCRLASSSSRYMCITGPF